MLRYLLLIVLFISFRLCSYAQNNRSWTDIKSDSIIVKNEKVFYEKYYGLFPSLVCYDSIKKSLYYIVKLDSTHYFFTQYIRLKNKGVPDSINHWYFKLNNKK